MFRSMEHYLTTYFTGHTRKSLHPTVESILIFSPLRHSHNNAGYRIYRDKEIHYHQLARH